MTSALRWNIVAAAIGALLLIAPFVPGGDATVNLACMMATMVVATLSYNILLGQTGLLSFGHALYVGLGGFAVANLANMAEAGGWSWFSIAYAPLAGGLLSLAVAAVLGLLNTRRTGVVFAMITLGFAEMVHAYALTRDGFFGGDAGVSFDRTSGGRFLGFDFGPQVEVYGLIAVWLVLVLVLVAGFRASVLGDLCRAVRDNDERVEFLGLSAQGIRYRAFCLSAFVAGIAGALIAINFELVSAQILSLDQSSAILVATYIGGVGSLAGSVVGALVYVIFYSVVSSLTDAWPFHLGVIFVATVLFAPGGLSGLAAALPQRLRQRREAIGLARLALEAAAVLSAAALYVVLVEEAYAVARGAAGTLSGPRGWGLLLLLAVLAAAPFLPLCRKPSAACSREALER
ncbi:branched-chain amino acid ABC transporter permease [Acidimangrovimonas pyrenivorans]|uniref:Branched-chain amino acid ABC transporter permease n=1 Tax=Acidimangrovimonas pyrenivorans TaxID=2030798 RepID=A0ABV7ACI4_9RHOB